MKEILSFALLSMLISCGESDNQVVVPPMKSMNTNGTKLVRREIVTDDQTTVWRYFYNAEKLDRVECTSTNSNVDQTKFTFVYSGDLITQMTEYGSGGAISIFSFQYDANQRLEQQTEQTNFPNRTTFAYVNNNDVTTQFYVTLPGTSEQLTPATEHYIFVNGNVVQCIRTNFGGSPGSYTENYSYDGHHSPFSTIPGLGKMSFYSRLDNAPYVWTTNMENLNRFEFSQNGISFDHIDYQYTYNSYNYPVTCELFNSDGTEHGIKVFYYYE